MSADSFLSLATDIAFSKLEEVSGDAQRLDDPFQSLVAVVTAQGLIDNGGLEHFFAWTFPGTPSYAFFVEAYKKIGAFEAAKIIETSLAYFGVEHPEMDLQLRLRFIEALPEDYSHQFSRLSAKICGDESICTYLEGYAERNRSAISGAQQSRSD